MATATASTPAPGATPSGDKSAAKPERGTTKLDRIGTRANAHVRAAGQNIARHLRALEKTNAKHVALRAREARHQGGRREGQEGTDTPWSPLTIAPVTS